MSVQVRDFVVMDEQRKSQRRRALKGATIAFGRAAIDCVVRNLSKTGACLEIVSPIGIPDEFTLVIPSDKVKQQCQVVWRTTQRIGVSFT
jgi:hypothetical protein